MKKFINFLTLSSFIIFTFISCKGAEKTPVFGELSYSFNASDTMYEDAEDGSVSKWVVKQGFPVQNVPIGSNASARSIFVRQNWLLNDDGNFTKDENGYPINAADYELTLENKKQFILEFDIMKKEARLKHSFTLGVKINTKLGERDISFNTYFDFAKSPPIEQWIFGNTVKEMVFPLSKDYSEDYISIGDVWKHVRLDIREYLHVFEPNNEIIEMKVFYFQGGDNYLDNIRLVSQ